MSRLMIIGCGGVASVAIHKCCQNSEVFEEIMIASRTVSKCDALKEKLQPTTKTKITTAQVDADNVDDLVALMESYKPDAVLNVALPYQDLTIMDACLKAGVDYIDTANYEAEDTQDPEWRKVYEERCKRLGFTAYFDYSWQWAYKERFEQAGLTALLGTGFDPGVTSVFAAYAKKHYFDEIHTIDILDCNGGDHGGLENGENDVEENLQRVAAVNHRGFFNRDGNGLHEAGKHEHRQTGAEAKVDDADVERVVQLERIGSFGEGKHDHLKRNNHGEYAQQIHQLGGEGVDAGNIPAAH